MCEKFSEHRKYNTYDLIRTGLQKPIYEAEKIENPDIAVCLRENEILQIVNSKQNPCTECGIAIRKDVLTLDAVRTLVDKKLLELVSFNTKKDFILIRARYK